ncbi:MAG: type II toxin-antitoxin system VapC family toxin [Bryobacteraceae bacterium]|nr:type II toxin-antitoxin system VapC family toxin [Bryobacteraceae bacterium]
MRYLLDTNIVSDLVRNPQGRVRRRIEDVGEAEVATSIVVAAELRYGAAKKGSARLTAQVETILEALAVLPLKEPVDRVYGTLRVHLERKGQPIGGNDLLIAAQAIFLGVTLVTANNREFARLEDLRCENWLV